MVFFYFLKIKKNFFQKVPLTISLCWSSPEFEGTAGPLIGYRVEFRRSELEEWEPAHDDLLGENECKSWFFFYFFNFKKSKLNLIIRDAKL